MKIKLYIDTLELRELLIILLTLPLSLVDVVKEEWFWWTKLYRFEISYPTVNSKAWDKLHAKALAETRRRIGKYQRRVINKR